jgi:hypothetical protein
MLVAHVSSSLVSAGWRGQCPSTLPVERSWRRLAPMLDLSSRFEHKNDHVILFVCEQFEQGVQTDGWEIEACRPFDMDATAARCCRRPALGASRNTSGQASHRGMVIDGHRTVRPWTGHRLRHCCTGRPHRPALHTAHAERRTRVRTCLRVGRCHRRRGLRMYSRPLGWCWSRPFLIEHQFWLGIVGGLFLCYLAVRTFVRRRPTKQPAHGAALGCRQPTCRPLY